MKIKRGLALLLALFVALGSCALCEQPPEAPEGGFGGEKPQGAPPDGMGGAPGGQSGKPDAYASVRAFSEDAVLADETIASMGADENALLVAAGSVILTGGAVSRESDASTGGDAASFYGVGAAILSTVGALTIDGTQITTDANGGAGAFAYGEGSITIRNAVIETLRDTSGGIHVAGGGTLYAENLTVTTQGGSSAAIRSDRGGGTLRVNGGSYTANGSGSPAVYVTADIGIENATLTATGSEALCLEGLNRVSLSNCTLTGNMPDLAQNDNTWTVILYQSMSGDSEIGKGLFEMVGGALESKNGGLFYTTNTQSEFVLNGVSLRTCEDCEYLLRCTGNQNARGWGETGKNGADCTFTAISQEMSGLVLWDSISNLDLRLTSGTRFTGAVAQDESCAGEGGSGTCAVTLDAASAWIVTGDSSLTALYAQGAITDENGLSVTVKNREGQILMPGDSPYTITADVYAQNA